MTKNYPIQKNNSGFSLIELAVSISILATTFFALVQAFPFTTMIIKSSEITTQTNFLAQEKIEELRSLGYENIEVGTIEAKHRLDASGGYLYNYWRETTVTYVDGDLNDSVTSTGMKKIAVNIYYLDAISKTEKSSTVTTLLTRR